MLGLTLPVARDLAGYGIRVVTILPGLFETPMFATVTEDYRMALEASVPFPSRPRPPGGIRRPCARNCREHMLNGEGIRLDGALRMQPR